MHSNFDQEINRQFEQAFERIETAGILDFQSVKNQIANFLGYCDVGTTPIQILQKQIIGIKKELQKIDSMSNHGYLYLAYETAKKKLEDSSATKNISDRINPYENGILTKLQGRVKVTESVQPEKKPILTFETKKDDLDTLIESIDFNTLIASLDVTKLASITKKSREIAKTLVEESDVKRATARIAQRLNSILNEVNLIPENEIGKKARFGLSGEVLTKKIDDVTRNGAYRIKKPDSVSDIGKIGDINLKILSSKEEPNDAHLVSHDDAGDIHHYLKLHKPKGFHDDVMVSKLSVKNHDIDSPIKMHDIYHHLINNGFVMMSDSSQSHGGLAIWKKLAATPGISVHGWNTRTDEPVNTDELLHDISDTHKDEIDDIDNHPDSKENDDILRNVRLIAHKKGLNESILNEIHMLPYEQSQKFEDHPFYGNATIDDSRDYLKHFTTESNLGDIGPLHVSQFEEATRSGPRGRILTHDDAGTVHHVLTYSKPYTNAPDTIKVKSITANDKNKVIGAHELYHHLLERGHKIESDDSMTVGGLKLWNKLSNIPGVQIHGWDGEKNIPVKANTILNSVSDLPSNTILVAHK